MIKDNNPYINKEYIPYKDKRWTEIPVIEVIKANVELTEEEQKRANDFVNLINDDNLIDKK